MSDPVPDAAARVALVTGAAKPNGIGAACARALAADGCVVVTADIDVQGAWSSFEPDRVDHGLADLVAGLTPGSSYVLGDVSSDEGVASIYSHVVERYGRIDVLVNNAAAPHGDEHAEPDAVPTEAWDRVLGINARGTFLMCREALRLMRPQRTGRIVNISSIAGRVGLTRTATYGASKAAIIGLTRSVAVDAARFGVTVNAVCPGFIDTNRIASSVRRSSPGREEAARDAIVARVPMGRLGTGDDVAAAVRFFASPEAAYVTGQVLTVDGGAYPS
jgi:NAD(P)-dependent dehydrogenase (short-subunit alcohol dehydrogenase family)